MNSVQIHAAASAAHGETAQARGRWDAGGLRRAVMRLPSLPPQRVIVYLLAVLAPLGAVLADALLVQLLPGLVFLGLLELLAVVLVALGLGAWPSVVATIESALLLNFLVLPPHFAWNVRAAEDVAGTLLFLLAGCAVAVVASRAERARREARAARAELEHFVSVAGHELRQPLTALHAGLQLMERCIGRLTIKEIEGETLPSRGLTPHEAARLRELVGDGLYETRLLNRHVEELLDVARGRSQAQALRLEACDLAGIARDVVREQRTAWPARDILLETDGARLPVIADADRMRQVLRNYLTNALKYSAPERAVTVTAEAQRGWARVAVRDAGPGLPVSEQRRIWERFHRVPSVRVRDGQGGSLGLGLHISKTIVEQHGGRLGVESAPGKGSTFWVALPLDGQDLTPTSPR